MIEFPYQDSRHNWSILEVENEMFVMGIRSQESNELTTPRGMDLRAGE